MRNTVILSDSERGVRAAAGLLRAGELVAIPTETVYGLAGDARSERAVAEIFVAKDRPAFNPLIVHVADLAAAERLAGFTLEARALAERFWPGPLTLVLPKRAVVPDLVTAGRSTVAVRVPALHVTRDLLGEAGVPIAAPSANPFGRISPTTAAHVAEQLGDAVDYILDTGPCSVGIESTVVDVTGDKPVLLRHGGIALEDLERVVGRVEPATERDDGPQRAPGMLSRHYSPSTPLVIEESLRQTGGRVGLLTFVPVECSGEFERVEILSARGDLVEAAANFFAALRRLDAAGLDRIIATPFPETGLGRALNDRLRRAAARD
jgi:L-threonylcarbamoyladenylate synthase